MTQELDLESRSIGALPLIEPLFERLRLRHFLEEALGPPDRRLKIPVVDCALLLIRNFTLSRHPLYSVPEWAGQIEPSLLGLEENDRHLLNDDRLGRALDKLFMSDLRSLGTRVSVHLIKEFGINLERLHNDSTTITFSGVYSQPPPRQDGRRRLRIVHGHNKDHRPDLKQLVWSLTVSADGAVPVHYNVYDGNTNDDTTHIEIWDALCRITGRNDFIYVADSKLCTRGNMGHISDAGGRFITVLPRSRKEDAAFKEWMLGHTVPWEIIWDRAPLRRKSDPPERFEAMEGPQLTSEGYRIIWYRSSEKWKRDERFRDNAIQAARFEIHRLQGLVGKRDLKTRQQVQAAVDAALDKTKARPWVKVTLEEHTQHKHTQTKPGRPGKNTTYVRKSKTIYRPVATVDEDAVRASAVADGVFPLVTNITAESVKPLDVLQTYKYQAFVEKRHEQLKSVTEIAPVNLKSVERIEAFLCLYFLALTVHALVEREVRAAMKERGLKSIPIYPEERLCKAPTADKLFELFEPLRRHRLFADGRPIRIFWDPLTPVQQEVLDLLRIPTSAYGQ